MWVTASECLTFHTWIYLIENYSKNKVIETQANTEYIEVNRPVSFATRNQNIFFTV